MASSLCFRDVGAMAACPGRARAHDPVTATPSPSELWDMVKGALQNRGGFIQAIIKALEGGGAPRHCAVLREGQTRPAAAQSAGPASRICCQA